MLRSIVVKGLVLAVALSASFLSVAASPEVEAPAPRDPRLERLFSQLEDGGLPRDMALHWHLAAFMGDPPRRHGSELRAAAEASPRDRLVQWMWADATDADAGCTAADPCPGRAMALARLEPDNSVAWWPAVAEASRRGDQSEVTRLIGRMAVATRHDDVFVDAAEAWYAAQAVVAISPAELSELRRNMGADTTQDSAAIVAGIAMSAAMALPSLGPLAAVCDARKTPVAASRAEACARAGRRMQLGGNTMIVRTMGHMLLDRSGGATAADAGVHRRNQWLGKESSRLQATRDSSAELRRYFDDLLATRDEYSAIERQIVRLHGSVDPSSDQR
jgi:hypothetical protein